MTRSRREAAICGAFEMTRVDAGQGARSARGARPIG